MASSSDIRKLFKAFCDDPALHDAVRACKTPAEKHDLLRKAGYTPVTGDELKAELAKSLQPVAAGTAPSPEDAEFVGNVMHLAAADSQTVSGN
jgi:hypothetical protein